MNNSFTHHEPAIIAREHHCVSRANISQNALKVLRRLAEAGFSAYLVGGGVRDLLLGGHPKDFDIATSATPEQVYQLFSNCILIGRRFRLAHIRFGYEIIEVATFRGHPSGGESAHEHGKSEEGMILRDNVYGTLEEDAWRRDFTINALYYDLTTFSIVDYTGGMADIASRTLRMIGDPAQRFREDPVRMLRAIRFINKLDFGLSKEIEDLLPSMGSLLTDIPAARIFEEFIKLFMHGQGSRAYHLLEKYHLFYILFPYLAPLFTPENNAPYYKALLERAFFNTDARIAQEKPVTPAFLLAVIMWPLYEHQMALIKRSHKLLTHEIREIVTDKVLSQHRHYMALPRRFSLMIREIWDLQARLESPKPKQIEKLLHLQRFRAAYDFLLLRAESGDVTAQQAHWWTALQEADVTERNEMISKIKSSTKKRKRTKRAPASKDAPSDEIS